MQPSDRNRIRHMIDAGESAMRFAKGRSRADLDQDLMLLFALVRAVEIFGEAASRVTEDARKELPDVPWAAIVGMRNRLVHAYFDVDRDVLWATVNNALPSLIEKLRRQSA
jgi:uncharacterized protein with HEPN domain